MPPTRQNAERCRGVVERLVFSLKCRGVRYTKSNAGIHVKAEQSSLGDGVNRFQPTRWDLVLLSAQSQTPGCDEALADLCKLYWYPLYAFIRHRGYSPEDAQDLV